MGAGRASLIRAASREGRFAVVEGFFQRQYRVRRVMVRVQQAVVLL